MKHLTKHPVSSRLKLPTGLLGFLFTLHACTATQAKDSVNQRQDSQLYSVSITRHAAIAGSRGRAFDFVVAADVLPKVLTGYGPLPAVIGTSNQTGPWDQPGSSRTVHLQDGSTVLEQVTGFQRPYHFDYQVWAFTNPIIRRLADRARGEWTFSEEDGITQIEWTYTFYTDNGWARLPLSAIVKLFWRGYMDVCLDNTRVLLEASRDHGQAAG